MNVSCNDTKLNFIFLWLDTNLISSYEIQTQFYLVGNKLNFILLNTNLISSYEIQTLIYLVRHKLNFIL